MWTTTVRRNTTATKEQIWNLWADVPQWNLWDHDVRSAGLHGPFQMGTTGHLTPRGGPKTHFQMIECTYQQSFTNRSRLPLCQMDFIHTLAETDKGLEVTHQVVISGWLTFLFARILGNNLQKGLPATVDRLITLAEQS